MSDYFEVLAAPLRGRFDDEFIERFYESVKKDTVEEDFPKEVSDIRKCYIDSLNQEITYDVKKTMRELLEMREVEDDPIVLDKFDENEMEIFKKNISWDQVAQSGILTEDFMEYFHDSLNWYTLTIHQPVRDTWVFKNGVFHKFFPNSDDFSEYDIVLPVVL